MVFSCSRFFQAIASHSSASTLFTPWQRVLIKDTKKRSPSLTSRMLIPSPAEAFSPVADQETQARLPAPPQDPHQSRVDVPLHHRITNLGSKHSALDLLALPERDHPHQPPVHHPSCPQSHFNDFIFSLLSPLQLPPQLQLPLL